MRFPGPSAISAPRRFRVSAETQTQIQIVQWLRVVLPRDWLVVHVPNQGASRRNRAEAGILTAMGMVAGFPDLLVFGRLFDDIPLAWWLEVKAPRGRVEPEQSRVQAVLGRLVHDGAVVRSLDDVRDFARTQAWPVREVGFNDAQA